MQPAPCCTRSRNSCTQLGAGSAGHRVGFAPSHPSMRQTRVPRGPRPLLATTLVSGPSVRTLGGSPCSPTRVAVRGLREKPNSPAVSFVFPEGLQISRIQKWVTFQIRGPEAPGLTLCTSKAVQAWVTAAWPGEALPPPRLAPEDTLEAAGHTAAVGAGVSLRERGHVMAGKPGAAGRARTPAKATGSCLPRAEKRSEPRGFSPRIPWGGASPSRTCWSPPDVTTSVPAHVDSDQAAPAPPGEVTVPPARGRERGGLVHPQTTVSR